MMYDKRFCDQDRIKSFLPCLAGRIERHMKHGKFEAKRPAPKPVEQALPKRRRLPRWLLITVPVLVGVVLAILQLIWFLRPVPADWVPGGMTKEETIAMYQRLAQLLEQEDMNLILYPDDSASNDVPILLTLTASQSRACVDMAGLEKDLAAEIGKVARGRYIIDPKDYISLDRSALRSAAERTASEWTQPYLPSFAAVSARREGNRAAYDLTVNIGIAGRELSADVIYDALLKAYYTGNMKPSLTYKTHIPEKLDVEALCARFRTEPVNALLDESSFKITPDIPGSGIDREELERVLNYARPGQGYVIPMRTLRPEVTAGDLDAYLYGNILAEAHTPHSWVNDRTNNLILACKEIDGTIVMPGEVFSFNKTVGERTPERGFREATAYVGGASVPEVGGGVCQVASSIYYATLQADLPSVERHEHTFLVTYVPEGMDAAIYWSRLDFQFENTSPYPIKIEASVSDGEVHILLRGREWKNYTVELSSEVLDETPWETIYRYVFDDSYEDGETIVTPYTGCKIATYKKRLNQNGELIDSEQIAISSYAKRDKVVALRRYATPTEPEEPEEDEEPSGDD